MLKTPSQWLTGLLLLMSGCAAGPLDDRIESAGLPARLSSPATADAPALPLDEDADVADLLRYAALNNAGLRAAFEQWRAALEQVPQVTALPDPRFSYNYFIENVETRVGPQRHGVGLSQTLPWFGKLDNRGGVAMEAARAVKAHYDAQKLQLFYRVKRHWYEYYYVTRAINVVRENRDLVKYLEQVARTRFKVAAAGHPDVIRAQVELGKLDDRLRSVQDMRTPIAAQLNAALNRPGNAPLPEPREMENHTLGQDDEQLVATLHRQNPHLLALQHEMAQQRRAVALARREGYPDVTVGFDYIDVGSAVVPGVSDSGQDAVALNLSMNLPIWREKYDAGVRQALHRFGAATQQRLERQNLLEAELRTALFHLRDAHRKIDLYRDTLLPKARQALKATEAAFRAGSATFSDIVDAQRVQLRFELDLVRARINRAQRVAEAQMLVGSEQEVSSDEQ